MGLIDNEISDIGLQFGFHKRHFTIHAIQNLLNDIEDSIQIPKGKLYAIFIDCKKAFDLLNQTKLIAKLETVAGKEHYLARIIKEIMPVNYVRIDDGKQTSDKITQTMEYCRETV